MRAFSFQWAQRTWIDRVDAYRRRTVPYCASNRFRDAGLVAGDTLYVLALAGFRTEVLLIARLEIASRDELVMDGDSSAACLTRLEAASILGEETYGVPLYDAEWFVVPRPGRATPMRFDRGIGPETEMYFGPPGGETKTLFRDPDGRVNQQAIRSVRQLRPPTVAMLDTVLAANP